MNIEEKLINIIADELEIAPQEITSQTNLQADLGADSVDNVSILTHINHDLKIRLGEEDVKDVKTIADLTAVVTKASEKK